MDYKKLGFKCGLEIHQQLETHKLFCKCPSLVHDDSPIDIEFSRKLRTTVSELGKTDIAAKFEAEKQKTIKYQARSTSTCLVEFDEEPPHEVNKEALEIAIQIAHLLKAKIVDEIQFMRKIVVDGSNPTGFQRTALIATAGYLKTSRGLVSIPTICLEEEAAKKIKDTPSIVTYDLSRQGVALVELATGTEIKDPQHAKEVASIIGMILRSTNRVRRGIGTIRQDVNVSIKDHPRVEIKGFQDLKAIPKTIEKETQRQVKLSKEKKYREPHVRKANPDFSTTYMRPLPGAARMYPETDISTIQITKKFLDSIEIPELIIDRAINLEKKYIITPELAQDIIKQNLPFEYYAEKFNIAALQIAKILIEYPKEIKKRFNYSIKISKKDYELLFKQLQKQELPKQSILEVLQKLSKKQKVNFSTYKTVDSTSLEAAIINIIKANKDASFNALMGEVMKKFKGKVDGKTASDLLKKYL